MEGNVTTFNVFNKLPYAPYIYYLRVYTDLDWKYRITWNRLQEASKLIISLRVSEKVNLRCIRREIYRSNCDLW